MKKLLSLLAILLVACQQNNEKKPMSRNEMLLGEWDYDTVIVENRSPVYFGLKNFKLYKGSKCESKDGFFTYVNPSELAEDNRATRCFVYRGNETKYTISDDMLRIYDQTSHFWHQLKIIKVSDSSFVSQNSDGQTVIFKRHRKTKTDSNRYDAIIVSQDFFQNDTYLNKSGQLYFSGSFLTTREGQFRAHVGTARYNQLEGLFKCQEIAKMKDNYSSNIMATHSTNYYVTFIKDGKIYKTIREYENHAPPDFHDAHTQLAHVYQDTRLDYADIFGPGFHFGWIARGEKSNMILPSEGFYLAVLLHDRKTVEADFKPVYEISCGTFAKQKPKHSQPKPLKVISDGRYFRFIFDDKTQETYDLGYDFIKTNGWDKNLRTWPKV